MNSPVQVVLNAQNYVRVADVNPGGRNKDFYADRDQAFVQHRDKLVHQVLNLERAQSSLRDSEVLYAHVALQADAWAKSHRPISKIFSKRHSWNTFGGPLGSLVVELTPAEIGRASCRERV